MKKNIHTVAAELFAAQGLTQETILGFTPEEMIRAAATVRQQLLRQFSDVEVTSFLQDNFSVEPNQASMLCVGPVAHWRRKNAQRK
jgi:hypothetical protein